MPPCSASGTGRWRGYEMLDYTNAQEINEARSAFLAMKGVV